MEDTGHRHSYLLFVWKTSGYELRVFPTKHKFQLVRSPSGGGSGFPAKGKSSAIKGFRKANTLRLKADNDKVTAKVRSDIVAAVQATNTTGASGKVAFDQYGDTVTKIFTLYRVSNGKWTAVKTGPAPTS